MRRIICIFLLAFLGSCQFDPLGESSSSTETYGAPYSIIGNSDGSRRLVTSIPVPSFWFTGGRGAYGTGMHKLDSAPAGQSIGSWWRQNSIHTVSSWGSSQEFWYGWWLLDVYQYDRQRQTSPLSLESAGPAVLFSSFQTDSFKGYTFTRYISPTSAAALTAEMNGTTQDSVLGVFFRVWPRDTLVVAQTIGGSSAAKAGLHNGDRILTIDGRWASSALTYLADSIGSATFQLVYLRPNVGLDTVRLGRAPALAPSVFPDTLPGGIGYIRIGQFDGSDSTSGLSSTDVQFQAAAAWVESNSTGDWILDLRQNGGGAINVARCIASALVPKGSSLVQIRERFLNDMLEGSDTSLPLKDSSSVTRRLAGRRIRILQDGYTASASELLISALRENLGSSVREYGDTTFGKGIGQVYMETPLGGLMAITCLHLDPVSQSSYHHVGIAPEVPATEDSSVILAWKDAMATRSNARRLATASLPDLSVVGWNLQEIRHKHPAPLLRPRKPFQTGPDF
jgi:C-terminal processing protease CtpA/Prc